MGCGASKAPAAAAAGSAPEKPVAAAPPTTTDTGSTGGSTAKPERVQDMPPDWLPSIEAEYSSMAQHDDAKEMRDAFTRLYDDGGDDGDDSQADIAAIQKAFRKYDTDHSGTIEKGELRSLLADTLKLSYEQVDEYSSVLLKQLDAKDGTVDGKVEWTSFRKFYRKMLASEEAREKLAVKALTKASTADSTKQRALDLFKRADKERALSRTSGARGLACGHHPAWSHCRAVRFEPDLPQDGSGTLTTDELGALLRESLGTLAEAISDASKWDAFVSDALSRGDKDNNASWDADEFANFFGKCLAHPLLIEAYIQKVTLRLQKQP